MRGGIAVYCVVCDVGSIYITKIDDLHIRADDGRVKHARIEARGRRSGTRAVLDSSKREALLRRTNARRITAKWIRYVFVHFRRIPNRTSDKGTSRWTPPPSRDITPHAVTVDRPRITLATSQPTLPPLTPTPPLLDTFA
jgi:hypothetical protein